MYKYRNLLLVDLKTIHTVFVDAFSTYEVKIDMSIEKLEEMLKTRSFRGEYSIGCFDGDRLIGFSLSGYREIDNKKYCYDTGMGILKEYQNKKIGKQLISTLVEYLQEQNIDYFKLEVLENNIPAQKVYQENGFRLNRKLRCYEITNISLDFDLKEDIFVDTVDRLKEINETEYCSFRPSWQNSFSSYINNREKYEVYMTVEENKVLSYAIVHKISGDIMQLGVAESVRNAGYEYRTLSKMHSSLKKKRYTYLNVEDGSYISRKLVESGFKNNINQYEMILDLKQNN